MSTKLQPTWDLLIYVIAIIAGTIILVVISNRMFNRLIKKEALEEDGDPTSFTFLKHTIAAILSIAGFSFVIYMIPELRHIAQSLLAGAGIAAIVIGFASQQALSNIVGGIFLVMFKPYRINDRIKIRDTYSGIIEDINLRHTVIRNFENNRVIVPNSVMSTEIITNFNHTEDIICRFIEIGISFDSDIEKARQIMREEASKHPKFIDNRKPEDIKKGADAVPVRVISLGDFSVTLRAYTWAKDTSDAFLMQCDLQENIKKRFDAENIEIPFPYRTLHLKDPQINVGPPPKDKGTSNNNSLTP